ncbi:MAG: lysostaphin resistance A-like protein [Halobacteriaceae archaeon]
MDIAKAARACGVALYLGVTGLVAGTLCYIALADLFGPTTVAGRQAASAAGLGLGAGLVTFFYVRYSGRNWDFLDVRVPDGRGVGVAVAGLAAVLGLALGLDWLYGALGVETAGHSATEAARGGGPLILAVGILSSVLFVGPGEELLYRNVIQKHLYDPLGRPGAVVAASGVFALMHGPTYLAGENAIAGVASLSVVFALSLVLGAAYVRTENVAVPAAIHGAYNAVSFLAVVVV